mmetsp:Transcript_39697/g.48161  ORF Transcript_39697/g.48161 Transcript_39697/m.48161 type:complete len:150 (-) Transcript_39697:49-498(-)|eukprot:CAMPEP_0197851052 /NCGR_PEP_ID=MMETSP1438-20131217/17121_1 /TAXON_ID=1461541 /ORGANISM="Pterosperma sp., Strain CCMP1384" /LENGTH=149 /DNA_ID=CAMNT_0043464511 /DNA_START=164 /DNA_END=613 /DNA_ORIENTATION=+
MIQTRAVKICSVALLCALAIHCVGSTSLSERIPGIKTTYEVVTPGDGKPVWRGDTVTVHATGTIKETGTKFWSTKDEGQKPFTYQAGVRSVITGWDQGCLGMKEGEVRKLDIPGEEGYGPRGFPAWGIPPDGTLLFEIEVLEVKKQNEF